MAGTTRGRLVQINQVVFDQADFFQSDGFTRVLGITATGGQITSVTFKDNIEQPWPLTDGIGVLDSQVTSGKIYWNEIPSEAGHYNVRWLPNATGFWRILITFTSGTQILGQDYDVLASPPIVSSGLTASFTKP